MKLVFLFSPHLTIRGPSIILFPFTEVPSSEYSEALKMYVYVENEQVAQHDKLACLNSKPEYSRKKRGKRKFNIYSYNACPKIEK